MRHLVSVDLRHRAGGEFGRIPFTDRYQIERVVGRGGSGVVFAAIDRRLQRRIALKVLLPGTTAATGELHLHGEARTLASLSHPNLVAVYDTFLMRAEGDEAHAFLVLEYVDGPDLHQYLRAGRLTLRQVAQLGEQLCSGLAYVHEHGFLHQDLKPSNVLLSFRPAGDVVGKLSDFGTAIVLHERVQQGEFTVGTAAYLSPEQAEGADLTAASDIYALGLVLLEAATGEVAFTGTVVEAAMARLDEDPRLPVDLHPLLRDVVVGMTHRDPTARLPLVEAQRLLRQLQHAAEQPVARPPAAPPPAAPRPASENPAGDDDDTARFFRPQEEELGQLLRLAATTLRGGGAALIEHDGVQYRHRADHEMPELDTVQLRHELASRGPADYAIHVTDHARYVTARIGQGEPVRFLAVLLGTGTSSDRAPAGTIEALTAAFDSAIRLRESMRRALFSR